MECGAKQTEVDNDGRIPLLLAAQEGHLAVVEVLLESGSPIEARAHDGKTSLRMAALEGHKDLVHYLLMHGANQEYRDADGRSTLYVLALENHVEMAQVFLENGTNTESADLEGRSPLHVAAWQGHYQMADLLLRHGADPNARDNDARTPLQSAAWQGHAHIVRLLLDHKAQVDHTCNQGATALCIASQEGHENVVKVLLQFKADPNHADQFGRTATRVALKGGHKKVVKILEEYGAQMNGAACKVKDTGNYANVATATITKPTSASQALANAMAIANGHINGSASESPGSTFDKKNGVCSKSSSNVNTSSTNQSSHGDHMTFTQQLQQCSLGKNRGKPSSKVLSPVSEPESPASAPGSPYADEYIPSSKPSPDLPKACHSAGKRPVRIISNPQESASDEPIWQRQVDIAGAGVSKLELSRKGSLPEGPAPPMTAGIAMGQAALSMKSPESRRKRNGIVTNPNYSLNKNVNINGYYNKLSETMDGGYPGSGAHSSPSPGPSPSSTPSTNPATPNLSSSSKQKAARPNGLPLKKETPL